MTALELKITPTMTFAQMLRLAKYYFEATTSRFDNIQHWLNLSRNKDEPVSSFIERVAATAKRIQVASVTEEEWIMHRYHQSLPQSIIKEIKSYLNPSVKFDTASYCQAKKAAMDMDVCNKDTRNIRANKAQGEGHAGYSSSKRDIKDVSYYRCGKKGNYLHSGPVKRQDTVCTFKGCHNPNGHLIKTCRNKRKGEKPKGSKGKKKEDKTKKVKKDIN